MDAETEAGQVIEPVGNTLPDTEVKTIWPDFSPRVGCEIASAEALRAWLPRARPRDRFVYAVGEFLPRDPHDALLKLARQLFNVGLVTFVQVRLPTRHGKFETRFMAVRTAQTAPLSNSK